MQSFSVCVHVCHFVSLKGFLAACVQVEPCPSSRTSVVGASDASSSNVSPSASSTIGQREVGCVCLCVLACFYTV